MRIKPKKSYSASVLLGRWFRRQPWQCLSVSTFPFTRMLAGDTTQTVRIRYTLHAIVWLRTEH